jgi:hypothetical protein
MEYTNDFFTQRLSKDSAAYIKYLRIERQLTFEEIYVLAIHAFKELKAHSEAKKEEEKGAETAIGHSLCGAAMLYLDELQDVDKWFW